MNGETLKTAIAGNTKRRLAWSTHLFSSLAPQVVHIVKSCISSLRKPDHRQRNSMSSRTPTTISVGSPFQCMVVVFGQNFARSLALPRLRQFAFLPTFSLSYIQSHTLSRTHASKHAHTVSESESTCCLLLLTIFSLLLVVHVLIVAVGTHHYEEGNYKHESVEFRYEVPVPVQPYATNEEKH